MRALLGAVALLVLGPHVAAKDFGCGVSTIPQSKVQYGCGCGYYVQIGEGFETLFQSEIQTRARPRLFIDGELVTLTASPANADIAYSKVGDAFVEEYRHGEMAVRFQSMVSFVCPEDSAGCEVTRFMSTMTVTTPSCGIKVSGIFGDCGC